MKRRMLIALLNYANVRGSICQRGADENGIIDQKRLEGSH